MASECTSGSCGVEAKGAGAEASCAETCQVCETACGNDPLACAQAMWCGSFKQAMREVQVELLKERIRKAWGAKMAKAADGVVEGMGVCWQSMLAQAKVKADFRQLLGSLWQEGK